jgi:type IX secretion system PorP/SprF family membrane protein
MKKLLQLTLGIISFASFASLQAQDPELSQFYASPVYTNPAFTGTAVCEQGYAAGRAALNYRNQWPGLPGTFRTFGASWDQHMPSIGGGVGASVFRDVAGSGLLTTTTVSGSYSYLLALRGRRSRNPFFMRFGLQGAYSFKSIDPNKLKWGDQIVATQGFVNPTGENLPSTNVNYPNFNAGVLGYSSKFYVGFAAHNVIQPNWSFYNNPKEVLPIRYTFHGGAVLPLTKNRFDDANISPNFLFMRQRNFSQLNIGFYVNKGPFVSGLWYRQTFGQFANADAIIALVGFRYQKFKFGYSYDFTVSDGRSAIPSSHEISATVDWCVPPGRKPFRPLKCPEF